MIEQAELKEVVSELRELRREVVEMRRDLAEGKSPWLTLPKIMKLSGQSRAWLKKRFKSGQLPGVECTVRGGPSWKMRRDDFERLLKPKGIMP